MLFPIILIPLIIRKLSLESYGIYAIIMSVVNLLVGVLDFGFSYTATRNIAKIKDNQQKLSQYFSSVACAQILLLIGVSMILLLFQFVKSFEQYAVYLFICLPTFLGYALNPGWAFQGFEDSHINAIINVIFRAFTIIVLSLFLTKESGLKFLFLIYSIGFFGWGLVGIIVALKKYKISFQIVSFKLMIDVLKEGLNIFVATFISSIYLLGIPMILNLFGFNLDVIASYSIAERIIRGICSFISPLSISLIPYFVRNIDGDRKRLIKQYFITSIKVSLPFLAISLFIFFGTPLLIKLIMLYKKDLSVNADAINNIRIQSFIVFFSVFNGILGITSFVSLGYEAAFRKIMIIVLATSMGFFLFLSKQSNQYVGSITVFFTEVLLSLFLIAFIAFKFLGLNKYERKIA